MWNLINKINKQNRDSLLDTENSCQRGGGLGAWVKGKGIKQGKETHGHREQYGDYQREQGMGAGRKGPRGHFRCT